jgi:hypothetical protein
MRRERPNGSDQTFKVGTRVRIPLGVPARGGFSNFLAPLVRASAFRHRMFTLSVKMQ